ncbi:MAG: GMP/IMP nucleotidase [Magnetococcales bacterium]|nr:GMP/IMP nucleotidase [Magnetococcales bacterium]
MPTTDPDTQPHTALPWGQIKTVLLDMDGTLLDLNFDNVFFLQTVPQTYARQRGLSFEAAKEQVLATYKKVEGTLAWYDLDHWSRALGMDIPLLKEEVAHLIQLHPHVLTFLSRLQQQQRPTHLVTNAHGRSIDLKMARTPIGSYLTSVVSSHDLGHAKEQAGFWPALRRTVVFDPETTLLVDDSEAVLAAAQRYGIHHLRHISAPSSQHPQQVSDHFISISHFQEIMPPVC